MENTASLFEHELLSGEGNEQLESISKWTRFIGIVYAVTGIMMLILFIFMITQMDEMAQTIMNSYGMNQQVMDFVANWGKLLFGLVMVSISCIIFLNAYYLLQFRNSLVKFNVSGEEINLGSAFNHMGNFFLLATILSILSTISSVGLIVFLALR
jgi:hypothetical protein